MKRMNLRKTLSAAALIGATVIGATALAHTTQGGQGPGQGMMGGWGQSYAMGPGMMGSGWGQGGGMGSGMMGSGWGQGGGMGPGMMGGSWGHGGGMGPGMTGGYGAGPGSHLDLTQEQRGKIAKVQEDTRRKQWDLMGKMHDEQSQMNELYYSDKRDDAALSSRFRKMSELRQQMFDLSLSAQKQFDGVLTKEQRDKLKGGG